MAADEKDDPKRLNRRNFLKGAGAGAVVGAVAVAGIEEGIRLPGMQIIGPTSTVTTTAALPAVTASLTASPGTIQAGSSVTLTATPGGGTAPYTVSITCGDGTTLTASGAHTYATAGNYTALVTVTDSAGQKGYSTATIVVGGLPSPAAVTGSITVSPATVKAGGSVTFTATPGGGTAPYTLSIDCGDGTTLTAAGSHTYASAGNYTVLLTVTDSKGSKGYGIVPLVVTALPTPAVLSYEQIITLNVNGADHRILADNRLSLRDAIRDKLGLIGTKDGCGGLGECGACTVLADGKPILSCLTLAIETQGMKVVTSDGLANKTTGKLDPIQQAFIDNDGFQCGYCTGGYMMLAKGILAEIPHPTQAQVMDLLAGNLCRCEAYPGIIKSVVAAGGSS